MTEAEKIQKDIDAANERKRIAEMRLQLHSAISEAEKAEREATRAPWRTLDEFFGFTR